MLDEKKIYISEIKPIYSVTVTTGILNVFSF